MKVAIFVTNPKDSYSGGRYLSLVLAECLAARNHKVYYITNIKPIFFNDFEIYENHKKIELIVSIDFSIKPMESKFDFVILIPHQNPASNFYDTVRHFALLTDANLILFNFETPNWFNKYSPMKRSEEMWRQWKKCCEQGCLVLSMTRESQKYAKQYYTDNPEHTYFDSWYPAINSLAADRITVPEKEKRILAIPRLEDKHKGGEDILEIIDHTLAGYTLVLILGRGTVSDKYREKLEYIKKKFNINYEIKHKLSDEEKFIEIKRARLLLFPSYFDL
jgi:glycosyltransferase involved in cell wall biosynthesis